MILNHINLSVSDVAGAKSFLETYFGLKDTGWGDGNKNMAFLKDDAGMIVSLFKGKDIKYPGTFHIGFVQPNDAKVDELNARFKADGFHVDPPQRTHAWTFYVNAPGGFLVEVLC